MADRISADTFCNRLAFDMARFTPIHRTRSWLWLLWPMAAFFGGVVIAFLLLWFITK